MVETESFAKASGGSNRSFGLVFGFVFAVIGLWPLLSSGPVRSWALVVAGLFVLAAFTVPSIFTIPNKLWTRLGLLLGAIVAPIVMFVIFIIVVTPMGFVWRLVGNDPLRLKTDLTEKSYWKTRSGPVGSMKNQY